MLTSCHGHPAHAAGRRVGAVRWLGVGAALTGPGLARAAEPAVTWGLAFGLPALAAGAVAVGYLLGRARTRLHTERALRQAREEARLQAQLLDGRPWRTDALQQPIAVAAPGDGAPAALLTQPEVQAQLRSRCAFSDLRLCLPEPVHGHRVWLLRALPRHDDLGVFDGHAGCARPVDDEDAARLARAALPALLNLHRGAALVAGDAGIGWQVLAANEAARTLWPQLTPGSALPAGLPGLPPEVQAAFATPGQPPALNAAGWTVGPAQGPAAGSRCVVLAQDPKPESAPGGAGATTESDNFSFTVSHDLRAPIRVVEGFTRIVKEDYGRLLDRVANDHLDRVLGAAARMNLMIDALLTLARLSTQPLTRQPVNLSQLAGYVIEELRRSAPEREVEFEIEPGLATQGDPTLLRLVLENLLGNAWKYTARCDKAQISLRQVPHDGGVAYALRDNGAGFDMRAADRLFGLFQRLHSASEFPGTGVGLASVRRIVRRHGGEIWAEGEPGRGATFYFTLPR